MQCFGRMWIDPSIERRVSWEIFEKCKNGGGFFFLYSKRPSKSWVVVEGNRSINLSVL
jgi:hypothetical protein